jgi:hypothetical protein
MDRVELIALLVGGGVILVAIVAVFVLPKLGGDRRRGRDEAEYQPSRSMVEGGDVGVGD